jgi:hypothetical protein
MDNTTETTDASGTPQAANDNRQQPDLVVVDNTVIPNKVVVVYTQKPDVDNAVKTLYVMAGWYEAIAFGSLHDVVEQDATIASIESGVLYSKRPFERSDVIGFNMRDLGVEG